MQVIGSLPQHSKSCWAWLRSNIGGWNKRMNCLITMTREDWAWSTLAFYLNHSHGNAVDNAHIVHSVNLVSKTAQYKQRSKILCVFIKGVWDTGYIPSGLLAIPANSSPQLFQMASQRNIKSHFWAFNIQYNLGSKLEHVTKKFLSTFFTEIIETFWFGKEDVCLAFGCLEKG